MRYSRSDKNINKDKTMDSDLSMEVKLSRTGHPVPVVDGIHLHSIYNPIQEAEKFGLHKIEDLKVNQHILIFGLGLGYHVDSLENTMKEYWDHNFKILVIEPNKNVYQKFKELDQSERPNTAILCEDSVDRLFEKDILVNFLLKKPILIPHAPSFNLYKNYFKSFLSFKKDRSIESILARNELRGELCAYIERFDHGSNLTEIANQIDNSKKIDDKNDFLILMLREFSTQREVTL